VRYRRDVRGDERNRQDRRDALGVLLIALGPLLAVIVLAAPILYWAAHQCC